MRRASRTDATHAAIADAFRKLGVSVLHTHTLGNGAPDMFCAMKSRTNGHSITFAVEAKDGAKVASRRVLTPLQREFHAGWRGEIYVVLGPADVPDVIRQAAGLA